MDFTGLLAGLFSGAGLSGLTDVGASLIAFFGSITDGAMWRSLGWLLLGVLLMAAGLGLWVRSGVVSTMRSAAGV